MTSECRWLVGPSFLKGPESSWPQTNLRKDIEEEDPEILIQSNVVVEVKRPAIYELLERYSSWNVLKAKIVWLTRFAFLLSHRLHRSHICPLGKPTIPELENTENDIMRMIQQQVFSEEYNALSKSGKVKISSNIAKLNPFIGENNIIRVGSRLEYAHISYNAKFPPILPKQHWVSELLARHVHCSNAHIGQEHTLNILRQRVWICNVRSLVRKIIKAPATNGTFTTMSGYGKLTISLMFCDNLSPDVEPNFRGADKELKSATKAWSEDRLEDQLSQRGIDWIFHPPNAPQFSGVWERLIRETKRALKAILKGALVTEHVLRTVFCEVESILNSRPLTRSSEDAADATAITPAHFLLQRPAVVVPIGDFNEDSIIGRRKWKQAQILSNHFWTRWVREYLTTLHLRQKWLKPQRDVRVGDLVLVHEKKIPRGLWPIAIVRRVFPGRDNRIRTVEIKTKDTVLTRPIVNISLLEQCDN
ncbi:THAP domain-containing 2 [Paramuricea clavata]|uniref:THAP domain-containing 2 n=1 Tax=Paramuricea clavata TaxID=317549 RepID=A0A7D9JYP8_PARCT|nr:THAP domain-containing 2 [Paramuricea clavata]